MNRYEFEGLAATLHATGNVDGDGKQQVFYTLGIDYHVVFEGTDYYPSPMIEDCEGERSLYGLLIFFLAYGEGLQYGDENQHKRVQSEYNLTDSQMEFLKSHYEALQAWCIELEDRGFGGD